MPLTTYTSGEVLTAASLNANFTFAAAGSSMAIFNETQASGTAGGTFTSGSYVKRVFNTTVVNQITGCTLTSSVIALPAGSYFVTALAPALKVNEHKIKLRNTTDSTDIQIGSSEVNDSAGFSSTCSQLHTFFVLTGTKNIELQHRCATTRATDGLGENSTFGDNEIYAQITITKVA